MQRSRYLAVLLGAVLAMSSVDASAQLTLASLDGTTSFKLGLLGQMQGEWVENAVGAGVSQNLFLRRTRLLLEGKLGEHLSVFVDTDSPNLGKAGTDGRKGEGTIYIQDFVFTYAPTSTLKVDAGLLLLPLAYNGGQAATSLLAIDFGPYGFIASSPTACRVGRDYGLQLRGYVLSEHLEVRAGLFQGTRGEDATRPLRAFGRVAVHLLEAQKDFFYPGTTHGKRRLLDLGVSYDRQQDYSTIGADIFLDHPWGSQSSVTAQVDYWHLDGGSLLGDLPAQNVWFAEAGVYFGTLKLQPFLQFNRRDYVAHETADETFYQIGVAYVPRNHRFNLKVGGGQVREDGAAGRLQVVGQVQVLLW